MKPLSDRELGMDRPIARRDFLNGMAVSITTGALLAADGAEAQNPSATPGSVVAGDTKSAVANDDPPTRLGLRGQHAEAIAQFDKLSQGAFAKFPVADAEIHEEYDLVIVGGGISGLSAAYYWRTALGDDQKVLILDNHDDFGGHAKRNEFHYQGKTYLGYGGTMSIATPYPYSYAAKQLVKDLGIEVQRNSEFVNRDLETKYGLAAGTFFDKENFLEEKLVLGNQRQPGFFEKVPLSPAARKDLARLFGKNPDYMAGMTQEQKRAKLAKISYRDYLLNYAKVTPEAMPFFIGNGGRNHKRFDTTPALEAADRGSAGFNGLGLEFGESFSEGSYTFHFPDGNASIARLLVARLLPGIVPEKQSMHTIVQAPLHYDRLDQSNATMRIRLNSTVVRVQHEGASGHTVKVAYIKDGKSHAVRAQNCILACYNSLIPSLLPEIPKAQKEALAYSIKVPMLYTNVLLRNWKAFQKLGVSRVNAPGMYYPSLSLDPGTKVGGYQGVTTPDEPIVVHLVRSPNKPGLPRREQHLAGQKELLTMTFADHERKIRDQFARILAPGGFDPAVDIVGIAANRWPNGYAYTYDTLADPDVAPEQRPHVIGRQRFGRVTIANSDAGAAAFTNQAMDEAHRAVQELFVLNGLT
jgi:spermidine dehydrogenase